MRILAFQPNIDKSSTEKEKSAHVIALSEKVDLLLGRIAKGPIDLVVLPELSTIECSDIAYQNLAKIAEPLTGESFDIFSKIAKKHSTYISFSLPREKDDSLYISNIVINRSGDIETYYDKLHIAQFGYSVEKDHFKRGNGVSVFDIGEFRFGVIICYDFRFPEYVKFLVDDLKVNVILHPVAFKVDETFASWPHFVITRALENQVYFLSLNRAGEQWGESIFCPPWIDGNLSHTVFGKGEEAKVFNLSIKEIEEARKTYNFSADQLYDYKSLQITKF